jgi:hypothetical protein
LGREKQAALLLRASCKTDSQDWHKEKLAALLVTCWAVRTFPTPDEYETLIHEITAEIRNEVFSRGPLPHDPGGRLREVCQLLGASVAASREAAPPTGFSF